MAKKIKQLPMRIEYNFNSSALGTNLPNLNASRTYVLRVCKMDLPNQEPSGPDRIDRLDPIPWSVDPILSS